MSVLRTAGAIALATIACSASAQAPIDPLLIDGFESLRAMRIESLQLRDPHLFRDVFILGCLDATSVVNDALAEQFATDGDGDGLLDRSPIQLFRGIRIDGVGQMRGIDGACTAPAATTSCTASAAAIAATTGYAGQAVGTCLASLPGTTRPYSPAVQPAIGPCFATASVDQTIDLGGGLVLPLQGTAFGATVRENPTPGLSNGLMRGFVSEAVAATVVLPEEFGGGTLASVLPGGVGSCATGDDRDTLEGVSGWWFYFQYTASQVPYAE